MNSLTRFAYIVTLTTLALAICLALSVGLAFARTAPAVDPDFRRH